MLNRSTLAGWLGILLAFAAASPAADAPQTVSPSPTNTLESILDQAGTNRAEIERALREVPGARKEGILFLVQNMPISDLKHLSAGFLLENVKLAFDAWEAAPWHDSLSQDLFFNDVLPYASLTEERDAWRKNLVEKCAPMVKSCKTPGEAARRLNERIYPQFKVKYSTGRKRPDQSPRETMSSGIATCTGLSILLVDACRAVGVPARVAGTPMWANMRGNHTWVEVWDNGWHFVGAAEPDPNGLDRAWFTHDAGEAQAAVPEHAIYASSFRRTEIHFPLVWAPGNKAVSAVNVTDRYAAKTEAKPVEKVRLLVKVLDMAGGKRVEADLAVKEATDSGSEMKGKSRGETADLNDFAAFEVMPGAKYRITVTKGEQTAQREVQASTNRQEIITITLSGAPSAGIRMPAAYVPQRVEKALAEKDAEALKKALTDYLVATPDARGKWEFPAKLEKLLRANEPAVRQAAWAAYKDAPIHEKDKADFDAKVVNFEKYQSPYTVKTVGTRPANGWPLFIAMHGGGNAPKELNDSQWQVMQRYYRDHPEVGGYLYVALRAPNDTWNGFYDYYVYPLVDNLVRQFRLFGDLDPNKVFIMGYSHGGYGAFAIGPKIPDHFAAIHASAAAPTDGETTARTLRNTVFTCMVGEKDTAYGRYERDLRFKADVEKLRGNREDIYPVSVTVIPGNGHTGLPDRDKIKEMYPAVRNPVPRELTWLMTDPVVTDFFWLQVPKAAKQNEILASCRDNRFVVTANQGVTEATVWFDTRLINFNEPIDIELNGATKTLRFSPSLKTMGDALLRRGDPEFAFSANFTVRVDDSLGRLVVVQKP